MPASPTSKGWYESQAQRSPLPAPHLARAAGERMEAEMNEAAHWVSSWSLLGKARFVAITFKPESFPGGAVCGGGGYIDYEPNPALDEYFRSQVTPEPL